MYVPPALAYARPKAALVAIALSLCFQTGLVAAGISLGESTLNGNDLFEFPTSGGDLDFDVNFNSFDGVSLRIVLDASDSGFSALTWSGIYSNISSAPWDDFHVIIVGGPTIQETTVADPLSGGGLSLNSPTPESVSILFSPPEPQGLLIGLPGAVDPSLDWIIGLNGLGPGDSFDLQLAPSRVPEPAAFVLTFTGLALLGLARRWTVRR